MQEGFRWLMQGDTSHVAPLTIGDTSRIHFRGGSYIGISRANPTKHARAPAQPCSRRSSASASACSSRSAATTPRSPPTSSRRPPGGRLRVVHVPKTIDNDLDLPHDVWTFGYQTARAVGVEIVHNLMVDAKTTGRWYFVVAMGRKAGHLALGIGKAAGATLTLIPEEFRGRTGPPRDDRRHARRRDHQAPRRRTRPTASPCWPRGSSRSVPPDDLAELATAERDAHGNLRIDEINFGDIFKARVRKRLAELGIKATIVSKNIGYEVRCADPIPFDMEYTRDLGYCAAKYVIEGGTNALVSIQHGHFKPVPFDTIMDPETGRMRVRMVDIRQRPLPHRVRVHAAAQARRLRGPGRAREARRGREGDARALPRASSATSSTESRPGRRWRRQSPARPPRRGRRSPPPRG